MTDADGLDLERLAGIRSNRFEKRSVELTPAAVLAYEPATWRDAIVVVTAGEIEIECSNGESECFRRGDVLCLAPFPVRALRNGSGQREGRGAGGDGDGVRPVRQHQPGGAQARDTPAHGVRRRARRGCWSRGRVPGRIAVPPAGV